MAAKSRTIQSYVPNAENQSNLGKPEKINREPLTGRVEYKSESITLIFSVIIGLFIIMGVGQMYVGKVKRGIGILILSLTKSAIGFLLLIGGLALLAPNSATSESHMPFSSAHLDPTTGIIFLGIGIALLAGVAVLFFWQIFDARKLCRKYNEYVAEHGKRPW